MTWFGFWIQPYFQTSWPHKQVDSSSELTFYPQPTQHGRSDSNQPRVAPAHCTLQMLRLSNAHQQDNGVITEWSLSLQ